MAWKTWRPRANIMTFPIFLLLRAEPGAAHDPRPVLVKGPNHQGSGPLFEADPLKCAEVFAVLEYHPSLLDTTAMARMGGCSHQLPSGGLLFQGKDHEPLWGGTLFSSQSEVMRLKALLDAKAIHTLGMYRQLRAHTEDMGAQWLFSRWALMQERTLN
jgi:hypothetical protein